MSETPDDGDGEEIESEDRGSKSGEGSDSGAGAGAGADTDADTDTRTDAPLADLARQVSERRRQRESGAASTASLDADPESEVEPEADVDPDEPFRKMSVAEIDEESLWSSLEDASEPSIAVGSLTSGDAAGEDTEGAKATDEPNEHVISKGDYCQKCPYLHDPPELACTHEGTDIVAVEDAEHFRVRNCPMVDE
ncbi:hypothetical protein [Halobellus rubicundus]|uniref:DUF8135 domain-containing protein n=1 Tax=Halobellus rubicundus TaxID=2996466 RepID=A0ABD5MCS5_9EURY